MSKRSIRCRWPISCRALPATACSRIPRRLPTILLRGTIATGYAPNFFAKEPDDRFCDPAEILKALSHDFHRIYSNPLLGDIVQFIDEAGNCMHSAVFVADDFVFTKNGVASSRPWMLMRLEDLKGYYPTLKPAEIRYFRREGM